MPKASKLNKILLVGSPEDKRDFLDKLPGSTQGEGTKNAMASLGLKFVGWETEDRKIEFTDITELKLFEYFNNKDKFTKQMNIYDAIVCVSEVHHQTLLNFMRVFGVGLDNKIHFFNPSVEAGPFMKVVVQSMDVFEMQQREHLPFQPVGVLDHINNAKSGDETKKPSLVDHSILTRRSANRIDDKSVVDLDRDPIDLEEERAKRSPKKPE